MKRILFILYATCVCSCKGDDASLTWIDAGAHNITGERGIVKLDGNPITGIVYSLYPNGDTEYMRTYVEGKLNGVSRNWYETGRLKSVYHYCNDVYEGNVKEWFPNGRLYRSFNYSNGQEEGMETMYWDNGKIRANYQSKNGRKYGFTGIKNCTSPWTDSLKLLLTADGM